MPELPDVETARRYLLSSGLVGRRVVDVDLSWPRALVVPGELAFRTEIRGRSIGDIRRRAKFLVFELDGLPKRSLIIHFRMTGRLTVIADTGDRPTYTRNVLLLDGGAELCFVDHRKLGKMWLVEDEDQVLGGLGPEPLEPGFTHAVLRDILSRRHAPVKALLCDQTVVAGIGNIYADEVLFTAGVHPTKGGGELSTREVRRIHRAIVDQLTEATALLAESGSQGGGDREEWLVPRSEDEPCRTCAAPVARVRVRGRSTYFCPACQG